MIKEIRNVNCPFCPGVATATLKNDRRGHPYFSCMACHTRAFLGNEIAVENLSQVLRSQTNYGELKRMADNRNKQRKVVGV